MVLCFIFMRKALTHLKSCDPVMERIIHSVGPYRMVYREPVFETLVRSIVYQQVSGKAAASIYSRVQSAMPRGVTPRTVLRFTTQELRALGLSQQKAAYILDLADRTQRRRVCFEGLCDLADEQVIEQLTQVKGIGVWTAQMFLMFALKRPDVFPTADLGVRSAIRKAYNLSEMPKPRQMEEIAEPWRPYRSVASWYLWRTLDGAATL
jgi:DNA-3-methyladenine glycosylase II